MLVDRGDRKAMRHLIDTASEARHETARLDATTTMTMNLQGDVITIGLATDQMRLTLDAVAVATTMMTTRMIVTRLRDDETTGTALIVDAAMHRLQSLDTTSTTPTIVTTAGKGVEEAEIDTWMIGIDEIVTIEIPEIGMIEIPEIGMTGIQETADIETVREKRRPRPTGRIKPRQCL